ncbi:MAG: GDP-mannose 4,6-dehydratase [Methanoregula sp.]|nr:GDP-mannose 4,6-dehydratase [Methanoregula sp.]
MGSYLTEHFLKDPECGVICLDNFDDYYDPQIKRRNIERFTSYPNYTIIKGDIRDKSLLKKIMIDIDYIFHEAAQAGVRISVEDPIKSHEVNATGTLNLLETARNADVKKIINASSSSVYGKTKYLPFDEAHPTEPVSPYGVSKLMAEHYCRVFQELYDLKTVSLRYFTVYGPFMRPDLAIHIFMHKALHNEPIIIFGDGTKTRDFTFIKDIVQANIKSMNKGSGIYNIGGGYNISVQELAEKIIAVARSTSKITYENAVKGDAEHTSANIKKAEKELGWVPKTTLDEGLEIYKKWIQHYQL